MILKKLIQIQKLRTATFLIILTFMNTFHAQASQLQKKLDAIVSSVENTNQTCLKNNPSNLGMRKCYVEGSKHWDKALNEIYHAKMIRLSTPQKELLKKSQQLWIKHRDAEFKFMEAFFNQDGSMYPTILNQQRMNFTKDRVLQLNRYYYIEE